jgi:hypothetical protein
MIRADVHRNEQFIDTIGGTVAERKEGRREGGMER